MNAPMNPGGLSPEAEARLARQADGVGADLPAPDWSDHGVVARWRAAQHEAWGEGTEGDEIAHERAEVGGCPVLVAGDPHPPVVLHLHAGGWSLGSAGTDVPITARLATRLRVVSLDYRLAPEHPFPAGLDDATAVYDALVDQHGVVAISGVSAGGNLAIGVARRRADRPPSGLALLCPHVDLGTDEERPLLDFEAAYVGANDRVDPWLAPARLDDRELATLPPTLVQWTDTERMAASIGDFANRLAVANPGATIEWWQGLWHAWHYHRELPEAWHAVDRARDWLVDRTAQPDRGSRPV